MESEEEPTQLKEVYPRKINLFVEEAEFKEILSKPKIMPIKSFTLLKLEQREAKLRELEAAKPT